MADWDRSCTFRIRESYGHGFKKDLRLQLYVGPFRSCALPLVCGEKLECGQVLKSFFSDVVVHMRFC